MCPPKRCLMPLFSFSCSFSQNRFYHTIGNAVCPPVVAAIAAPLVSLLQDLGLLLEA